MVYDQAGHLKTIDFNAQRPRFLRQGTSNFPVGTRGPLELVKAADMPTYRRLSAEWWVRATGRQSMDAAGTHDELIREPNGQGLAYVRPGELVPANDS